VNAPFLSVFDKKNTKTIAGIWDVPCVFGRINQQTPRLFRARIQSPPFQSGCGTDEVGLLDGFAGGENATWDAYRTVSADA
jgi:hypothetical protein